jgi:hypothetical protein
MRVNDLRDNVCLVRVGIVQMSFSFRTAEGADKPTRMNDEQRAGSTTSSTYWHGSLRHSHPHAHFK